MVQERIQKLQNLRDQGIDPYPAKYQRTHSTKDAKALLETIELNGEDPKTSSAENVISIAENFGNEINGTSHIHRHPGR